VSSDVAAKLYTATVEVESTMKAHADREAESLAKAAKAERERRATIDKLNRSKRATLERSSPVVAPLDTWDLVASPPTSPVVVKDSSAKSLSSSLVQNKAQKLLGEESDSPAPSPGTGERRKARIRSTRGGTDAALDTTDSKK
jgi:hypothetical protein